MTARRRNVRGATPEGCVQSSILSLLEVERIWHRRMQSRTFQVPGKGGKLRPMFVGSVGMGDILATPLVRRSGGMYEPAVLWIECKREEGGVQSAAQKEFEAEVVEYGHYYLLARSIDDVRDWMQKNGVGR